MSAIPASSVNLKTMADGTLRISFDIEPIHAQDAFKLFAAPGTQAAIAALKAGTHLDQPKDPEKPKGGELARLAGMWNNDTRFWSWVNEHFDKRDNTAICSESHAAKWTREFCGIGTRADLDHIKEAAAIFHIHIRGPFMAYLQSQQPMPLALDTRAQVAINLGVKT